MGREMVHLEHPIPKDLHLEIRLADAKDRPLPRHYSYLPHGRHAHLSPVPVHPGRALQFDQSYALGSEAVEASCSCFLSFSCRYFIR